MMRATMAIWRQPVAERRAKGSLGLSWFLLGLFLIAVLSLTIASPGHIKLLMVLSAIPMGLLLIMWWVNLCGNVSTQLHPAALQLVPDLRRRAVLAVVLAWALIVAIMTALAGVPAGRAPQVAVLTALVLIETSFLGAPRRLAVGCAVLTLSNFYRPLQDWMSWCFTSPAAVPLGIALVLVEGALALRRLARADIASPSKTAAERLIERSRRGPGGRPARASSKVKDPQAAFLRPLGRSWFDRPWGTLCSIAVTCAGLRLWAAWQANLPDALAIGRMLLAAAVCCALAMLVYREARRFATARTEQALLCLSPGAPDAADLNRLLARSLLLGFARVWLLIALVAMAAFAVLGAGAGELARLASTWCVASILVAFPLRDFARERHFPGWSVAALLAVLLGLALMAVVGHRSSGPWLALAACSIVASAALARWRWHVMLAAQPALPAGRIPPAS